ncbi:hypothetical protein JOQ06_007742 [Pogonophryne albipinna]|uniref:HECT domain-containing protein n=1 Tax=Pogonophryne albipinna TaxID=1090488 RepID=A0AAD6B1F0_9TELE|nr:hypothetical protein JOQ06_007742 [Pogonophryne albipinna]
MEARTISFWRDWLLQVEDGENILNVGDVLAFATGLRKIPAVGLPTQPKLNFLHPEDGPAGFPTANTCGLILRLPVCTQYHLFKDGMENGISWGGQFGVS